MAIFEVIGLGLLGSVVPTAIFIAAKARPIDVGLAAVGYGGLVAVIAAIGPFYSAGPYLFVPLAVVFTVAWTAATSRVVHHRRSPARRTTR